MLKNKFMIRYTATPQELNTAVEHLHAAPEISIDLEFDKNYYRYGFNLCLMQVMADSTCYLVDPLSDDIEIDRTFQPLENPKIPKTCFAFGEDIRLLHTLGCYPKNVLDLSLAANLLNYQPMSLTQLLIEVLGVRTGKAAQMSNWYKRPLTGHQKQYAAEDVMFLPELREQLMDQAEKKGVTSWILEENQVWETEDFAGTGEVDYLKDKDRKGMSEMAWHLYTRLIEFREKIAQKKNMPSYKVIDKSFLRAVATKPGYVEVWHQERGVHPSLRNKNAGYEAQLLVEDSLEEARELGLSDMKPAEKKLSKEKLASIKRYQNIIRHLKQEVFNPVKQQIGREYGENTAAFILNNRVIEAYVSEKPEEILPYRRELIEHTAMSLGMHVEGSVDEAKRSNN
ncbi:ribonuclease D [Cyclonatronum proteinivorum]|nr:ribonuclease D [Cyclonatronum proteinivorum]